MKRNMRIIGIIAFSLFIAFALQVCTYTAVDERASELWSAVSEKWDNEINSYECDLFSYTRRTDSYIKNFPDMVKPEDKPDWDYRRFHIRYKKPGKSLLTYLESVNEDTNNGSIIDRGVAYMLKYASGTTFNYGYKNDDTVYIVFPYLTNKQFKKLPISLAWKGALKLLMIASRKEVYHQTLEETRDLRGNELGDLAIGKTMKRFDHYFNDADITAADAAHYMKSDFVLNKKTGMLTMKSGIDRPADAVRLTIIPKDVAANKGITKVIADIDPKTKMFLGFIEYEKSGLVQVMLFSDLTENPELPDKLWEDYFKGRKISDKK